MLYIRLIAMRVCYRFSSSSNENTFKLVSTNKINIISIQFYSLYLLTFFRSNNDIILKLNFIDTIYLKGNKTANIWSQFNIYILSYVLNKNTKYIIFPNMSFIIENYRSQSLLIFSSTNLFQHSIVTNNAYIISLLAKIFCIHNLSIPCTLLLLPAYLYYLHLQWKNSMLKNNVICYHLYFIKPHIIISCHQE